MPDGHVRKYFDAIYLKHKNTCRIILHGFFIYLFSETENINTGCKTINLITVLEPTFSIRKQIEIFLRKQKRHDKN